MRLIELVEFGEVTIAYKQLSEQQVARLQREFASQVRVELLLSDEKRWRLTAQGWVGSIPLGDVVLMIRPKIPLSSLLRLLEIVYDLDLNIQDGLIESDTMHGFYDRLANQLATMVLQRVRRGLYRSYQTREAIEPFVRGKLRVRAMTTDLTQLPLSYQQFSADVPHNQALLYALELILATELVQEPTARLLRKARRALRNVVAYHVISSETLAQLSYDRLNADYRPMHALARLFIEQSAPLHEPGGTPMLPFLIDMATLFERFVARWLTVHLPPRYRLAVQERSSSADGQVQIAIDLVLIERATGRVLCVLDTKWKSAETASSADIYQITFYANSRDSSTAALIYPTPLKQPLETVVRDVRLRSLVFDVSAEVDHAGEQFMIQLQELTAKERRGKASEEEREN